MKAKLQFAAIAHLYCEPIRKRRMEDIDFTPKPIPTRRQRKLKAGMEVAAPRLFSFFG